MEMRPSPLGVLLVEFVPLAAPFSKHARLVDDVNTPHRCDHAPDEMVPLDVAETSAELLADAAFGAFAELILRCHWSRWLDAPEL